MNARKVFLEFANKIKSMGYEVYISNNEYYNYGYIIEGNKIGYFQLDNWEENICFSTCNKPSPNVGTGYALTDKFGGIQQTHLTHEHIQQSFMVTPEWDRKNAPFVKKWESKEKFFANHFNKDLLHL